MIKGIHHIGLTVPNLDEATTFFQNAAGWSVTQHENDRGRAVLIDGHTTCLELIETDHSAQSTMPVYGPGITHVCFQSAVADPAFDKFCSQGATMHSRGDRPVKLARPDIVYVYLRDLAGNIFEVEQWDDPPQPHPVWIAHVALVSPNIERLNNFYSTVLLEMDTPPEIRRVNGIPNLDVVGNADEVDLYGTWIPFPNLLLEIWQFINPQTPAKRSPDSFDRVGYTHVCFEVEDIVQEVTRLQAQDVAFLSEPRQMDEYRSAFAHDPDGNLFELRQY